MNGEHEKILRMVEEGTISVEEAQELLDALDEPDDDGAWDSRSPLTETQFQKNWQRPFNISLIAAAIGGSLWIRTRKATGFASLVRAAILLPMTVISLLAAVITYISKDGPWLHIRVRSAGDERFALSLPFPLKPMRDGLQFVRSQIQDDELGGKMDAVAELLDTMETADLNEPVSIDIEDRGDNIQIFLG